MVFNTTGSASARARFPSSGAWLADPLARRNAFSAIGGAVSAGVAFELPNGVFGAGNDIEAAATRGAVDSVVTQGIGVATGLQHSFSWVAVATAGVEGGVIAAVSGPVDQALGLTPDAHGNIPLSGQSLLAATLTGTAALIAGAATRSLVTGEDFGQSLPQELPNVVGETIGNLIGGGLQQTSSSGTASAGSGAPRVIDDSGDEVILPSSSSNVGPSQALAQSYAAAIAQGMSGANDETSSGPYLQVAALDGWMAAKLVNGSAVPAGSDATGQAYFLSPGGGAWHGSYQSYPSTETSAPIPIDEIVVTLQAPNVGPIDTQPIITLQSDVEPALSIGDLDTSVPDVTIDSSPAPGSAVATPGAGMGPNLQNLGQVLGMGEGNYESYNTGTFRVPGGRVGYSVLSPPPGTVTGRTINQILATSSLPGTNRNRMFAVGAYQITQQTLRGAVSRLGLTGNERLTPQLQDRIFRDYLVPSAGNGALGRLVNHGVGTVDQAQFAAAQQWASVASPAGFRTERNGISNGTMSYYGGPANRANMTETRALRALLLRITH